MITVPLRAMVLIFLFGTSLANAVALKQRLDLVEPGWFRRATAWIQPRPTPSPIATDNPFIAGMASQEDNTYVTLAYDAAWLREAIIVTIAGVAWFLLRAREKNT